MHGNIQTFALGLCVGAALLALWIVARFPSFGPRSIVRGFAHMLIATVLLRLMPDGMDAVQGRGIPLDKFVAAFAVALPAFVYAFLTGAWITRAAVDQIGRAQRR